MQEGHLGLFCANISRRGIYDDTWGCLTFSQRYDMWACVPGTRVELCNTLDNSLLNVPITIRLAYCVSIPIVTCNSRVKLSIDTC